FLAGRDRDAPCRHVVQRTRPTDGMDPPWTGDRNAEALVAHDAPRGRDAAAPGRRGSRLGMAIRWPRSPLAWSVAPPTRVDRRLAQRSASFAGGRREPVRARRRASARSLADLLESARRGGSTARDAGEVRRRSKVLVRRTDGG